MGYVKLFKADRTFDLLPADDIVDVTQSGNTIVFSYSTGNTCTVNFSSIGSKDSIKIVNAVLKIEGASGEGIAPDELSVPITSISTARI
tara:strand:- start:352 stop:618 length:267 start_codon:yes stop_codon:yes gene_type:complete